MIDLIEKLKKGEIKKIAIKEGNYLLRTRKWIKQGKLLCVRKRLNISLQAQTY